VSLLDVKENVGLNTTEEFNSVFGSSSAMFVKCDVCNQQQVEDAFQQTYSKFGKLDIVVNNAGVFTMGEDWQKTVDINLIAVMRCCYVAAEYMKRDKRGGHIINISSAAGLFSVPFDPAYVASKHGVVGLSRSLSELWEDESIRVSCLCPSYADTDMMKDALKFAIPSLVSSVKILGLMSIDKVVEAFKKLVEEQHSTGGVLMVNPMGIHYKFPPRTMKTASKL